MDSSSVLTDMTVLDSPKPYAINSGRPLPHAENKSHTLQTQVNLLDFSNDLDNNIDEDLANVPLDYGRGLKTKQRGECIKKY
jgi:hypothetical protein